MVLVDVFIVTEKYTRSQRVAQHGFGRAKSSVVFFVFFSGGAISMLVLFH